MAKRESWLEKWLREQERKPTGVLSRLSPPSPAGADVLSSLGGRRPTAGRQLAGMAAPVGRFARDVVNPMTYARAGAEAREQFATGHPVAGAVTTALSVAPFGLGGVGITTRAGRKAAAKMLAEQLAKEGGFSVRAATGEMIGTGSKGYAVGLGSERSAILSKATPSADDIEQFIKQHQKLLKEPNAILGGWVDDKGITHIEPSEIVHSRAEAVKLGAERKQQAVWDFSKGSEIPTAAPAAAMRQLRHFSPQEGLTQLESKYMGTGPVLGAERIRTGRPGMMHFYDEGAKPDVGYKGLPEYRTEVAADKVYDIRNDPAGIVRRSVMQNKGFKADIVERAIKKAGYAGYENSEYPGTVKLFSDKPIPVTRKGSALADTAAALGARSLVDYKEAASTAARRERPYRPQLDERVDEMAQQVRDAAPPGSKFEAYLTPSGEIKLANIEVPKGARGAGAGTRMMGALAKFADAEGLHVSLDPRADRGKKGALDKFYRGLGYRPASSSRGYRPESSGEWYRPPSKKGVLPDSAAALGTRSVADMLTETEGMIETNNQLLAESDKILGRRGERGRLGVRVQPLADSVAARSVTRLMEEGRPQYEEMIKAGWTPTGKRQRTDNFDLVELQEPPKPPTAAADSLARKGIEHVIPAGQSGSASNITFSEFRMPNGDVVNVGWRKQGDDLRVEYMDSDKGPGSIGPGSMRKIARMLKQETGATTISGERVTGANPGEFKGEENYLLDPKVREQVRRQARLEGFEPDEGARHGRETKRAISDSLVAPVARGLARQQRTAAYEEAGATTRAEKNRVGLSLNRKAPAIVSGDPAKGWGTMFDYQSLGKDVVPTGQSSLVRDVPKSGSGFQKFTEARGRAEESLRSPESMKLLDEGIKVGGERWYYMDPLARAFMDVLGEKPGMDRFNLFNKVVASTSPNSEVGANIRRAGALFPHVLSGRSFEGVDMNAVLAPGLGNTVANTAYRPMLQRAAEGSEQVAKRVLKADSFKENLSGNFNPATVDRHFFRQAGQKGRSPLAYLATEDAAQGVAGELAQAGRLPVAEGRSATAPYQSALWIGDALRGRVASPPLPALAMFEQELKKTAALEGLDPNEALRQFIRGKLWHFAGGAPGLMK